MYRTFVRLYSRSAIRRAAAAGSDTSNAIQSRTGEFKWTHLQSPFTLPSFQSRLRELDSKLSALRGELVGVPESIPEIEWAEFDDIEDKAAVEAIREEYEALKIPMGEADNVADMNAALDTAIQRTTENAKISEEEVARLRLELAAAKKEKVDVHNWTLEDYCRRYPGLAEQLRHEYMEGYTLPTDAMDRLGESDLSEWRKSFQAGAPPMSVDPNLPTAVGEFDLNKEREKLDAQIKKMFGDSPDFELLVHEVDAKLGVDAHAAAGAVAKHH